MSDTTFDATRNGKGCDHLSESQRHRVLADECRRILLAELEGQTEPISLDELALTIDARKSGDGQSAPDRIRISLHHAHLPLLDELGIVDYDRENNVIEPRRAAIDGLAD